MKRPVLATLLLAFALGCSSARCASGGAGSRAPAGDALTPTYVGADQAREKIPVRLQPVASGFEQPTALRLVPTDPDTLVVLEKGGAAYWTALEGDARGKLLEVDVLTRSEQGLLGIAFHPRFAENGRFFLNHVTRAGGEDVTRITEWKVDAPRSFRTATPSPVRTILEVPQPYANHNAGDLAFGPDGFLYVGLGDGGGGGDPLETGQDPSDLLGSMLRIDVDRTEGGKAYAIPADNPFVGQANARPELWAIGLRNPWRYSFAPDGRLLVADVGQNAWEEIDVVERGKNYGWDLREGAHCFEPEEGCPTEGLVDPIHEYPHDEGNSITGGLVYGGSALPALAGKYVFGDFGQGKLWAIDVPAGKTGGPPDVATYALGKFPLLPVTFGVDGAGELLVADFGSGTIHRIVPGA